MRCSRGIPRNNGVVRNWIDGSASWGNTAPVGSALGRGAVVETTVPLPATDVPVQLSGLWTGGVVDKDNFNRFAGEACLARLVRAAGPTSGGETDGGAAGTRFPITA